MNLIGPGAGVEREDSDDELGFEDYPWEWIIEERKVQEEQDQGRKEPELEKYLCDTRAADSSEPLNRAATSKTQPKIVGARMGDFSCRIGDCVFLKAEGTNEAWVALICEFLTEEDGTMAANFMWFSTEKEIRSKTKKRMDFLDNELYISPSWDINPLASINGKAKIVSQKTYLAKYPSGKVPRNSPEYGKIFICRRGCNTRTSTYTKEFIWDEIYHGQENDVEDLISRVDAETKATRKSQTKSKISKRDADEAFEDQDDFRPVTPRKKHKTARISTPTSQTKTTPYGLTTPSSKRIIIKKPLEFTPLGSRIALPEHSQSSPFRIARTQLHVASVPSALPCREQEYASVYSHLESAISDGSGSCIYISGTPGTGKTATVREVVAQLNASVMAEELDDFIFVEINGMKVTDPHQSYSLLWEALRGERVSPKHALDLLEREFSNPSPRRVPCVVLMDELDQLVTKNQSVMYNFFNWPGFRHSRLIVLAVANTMDLPERTLSNKISSRLGLTRITFPGYTHDQLMKIIQSRLEGVPGNIVDPDAIQFASRKVAAVSGDARRALDICRRAVEIAEGDSQNDTIMPPTPSKKMNKESDNEPNRPQTRVTIGTIKQAINEATSSPAQQYIKSLPLTSKLLLGALLALLRRSGLAESTMGKVIDEAKRMGKMVDNKPVSDYLLGRDRYVDGRPTNTSDSRYFVRTPRVIGMSAAATEIAEAGIISLEMRKGERNGRIRLHVGEDEIRLALKEDRASKGMGFS